MWKLFDTIVIMASAARWTCVALFLAVALTNLSVSVFAADTFDATYGSSPAPFKINVHRSFIEETILKVSHTRYTVDVDEPVLASGPSRQNVTTVRDYWINHYDWFNVQDQLNTRLSYD